MLISLWRLDWRAFTLFARFCKLWHVEVAVETQRDLYSYLWNSRMLPDTRAKADGLLHYQGLYFSI